MQFDWWTFALQAVNFLILIWLLWRFLYRPVKEVIEQRKKLAEQAFTEADREKAEAESTRQKLEDDRAKLAAERQDMLRKLHEESDAERRKIVEEAKQEANALMDEARKSIAEQRKVAVTEVRDEISALAVEMASEILSKADPGASSDAFLEAIEKKAGTMPASEVERLKKDLAADGARLTVVTAAPLAPEERERWTERLDGWLEQTDKTEFATDPEILGGAELRFPHAVIKLTWADQLEKARTLLQDDEAAS